MSKGLGRGFGALLPGDDTGSESLVSPGEAVRLVMLSEVQPNPEQPRKDFDEAALSELAESIREQGVIQPLLVEPWQGRFRIVAGERRWRAAKLAGLTEVPVIVRTFSEETRREIALIENIQREDLSALEEARAFRQLMETCGLTQDDVAKKVGKQRSTVANALRLLRLPEEMQKALDQGLLTAGHCRALLSVVNDSLQQQLFRQIVDDGLSVRESETRAQRASGLGTNTSTASQPNPVQKTQNADVADWEQQLIERLGARVSIKGNSSRGKIEIHYLSLDDLERLFELLGVTSEA